MIPEGLASKWRVGQLAISYEALGSVRVQSEEEWDEEVVCVPKGFVRLLSDFDMGGGEHHEHAEQHDVPCDATRLRVMYLDCAFVSYLVPFHVKKAAHVSRASGRRTLAAYLT